MRLRRGPTLSGRVVDDVGAPIARALVEASGDGPPRSQTTAADGTFTLLHVNAQRLTLKASAEGHRPNHKRVVREGGGWLMRVGPEIPQVEVVSVVEVRLQRLRALALRVVDGAGAPVPDFDVEVWSSDHEERYGSGDDVDGGYVAQVPFAPVEVAVEAEGFGPATRAVDVATRALTVTLERGARLEGQALDAERRPLAEWIVSLVDRQERRRVGFADAAGRFWFDGVAAGRHVVEVSPSASTPPTSGCDGEAWAELTATVDVNETGTTHVDVVAPHRARVEGAVAVGDERVWLEAAWGDADAGTAGRRPSRSKARRGSSASASAACRRAPSP
jgi:hypothetical protein